MIKFRAWHKEAKKMYEVSGIDFANESAWLLQNEMFTRIFASKCEFHEIELMQWTGLVDKDGREIYAGDIIILSILDHKFPLSFISFDKGSFILDDSMFANNDISRNIRDYIRWTQYNIEVVGNIYENPELLKSK